VATWSAGEHHQARQHATHKTQTKRREKRPQRRTEKQLRGAGAAGSLRAAPLLTAGGAEGRGLLPWLLASAQQPSRASGRWVLGSAWGGVGMVHMHTRGQQTAHT